MSDEFKQEARRLDFLALLTIAVTLVYVGAAAWTLIEDGISFDQFSTAIGPLAGLLVGYWVRGQSGEPSINSSQADS